MSNVILKTKSLDERIATQQCTSINGVPNNFGTNFDS